MRNQFRQQRRNQRWRMNRQMQDRRRLNLFLVERRVRHLEGWREVVILDLENTHALLDTLEHKVQQLLEEKKHYQAQQATLPTQRRFWQPVVELLRKKGHP